jgi:hypothetical protein
LCEPSLECAEERCAIRGRDGSDARQHPYVALSSRCRIGTLGVDRRIPRRTNDGAMPAPCCTSIPDVCRLYSDRTGELITDELWGNLL